MWIKVGFLWSAQWLLWKIKIIHIIYTILLRETFWIARCWSRGGHRLGYEWHNSTVEGLPKVDIRDLKHAGNWTLIEESKFRVSSIRPWSQMFLDVPDVLDEPHE